MANPSTSLSRSRPAHADADTFWEASAPSKKHKAICYVFNGVFESNLLRLRPAGTSPTRLLHPSCAHGYHITHDKIVNFGDLTIEGRAALTQQLGLASASAPLPGEPPPTMQPTINAIKHLEYFDKVEWDRALSGYRCLRSIPEGWLCNVWEARLSVSRAVLSSHEAGDRPAQERAWKLYTLFDAMILGRVQRRRGARRGQGGNWQESLNSMLLLRLQAFWSGAWGQLLMDADAALIPSHSSPASQSDQARFQGHCAVLNP
jgi:hypothetical protein